MPQVKHYSGMVRRWRSGWNPATHLSEMRAAEGPPIPTAGICVRARARGVFTGGPGNRSFLRVPVQARGKESPPFHHLLSVGCAPPWNRDGLKNAALPGSPALWPFILNASPVLSLPGRKNLRQPLPVLTLQWVSPPMD